MTTWTEAQGRMLKSARAVMAYFEHKMQTSLELLTEAPEHIGEGDVQFSLAMSQYGLWGVRSSQPLQTEEHLEIFKTFSAVLGGIETMEQRREDMTRLNAKLAQTVEEIPSNVIPLRRPSARAPEVPDRRWVLRLDCLIESKYLSEIHKMAMELHAHSGRYAFVEYRDLDAEQRLQLPELLSLGAITLFVSDLTNLSPAEQEVLLQLVQTETVQRPLVMAGALMPFADMRGEPGVNLELLTLLARAYIKLSRPFREYKEQGLIHYFLDCLSDNPT